MNAQAGHVQQQLLTLLNRHISLRRELEDLGANHGGKPSDPRTFRGGDPADLVHLDRRRDSILSEMAAIDSTINDMYQEHRRQQRQFQRPQNRWARIVSYGLGPLPDEADSISYDRTEFIEAPSRWPLAIATFLTVAGGAFVLTALAPVTAVSPANLALGSDGTAKVVVGLFTSLLLIISALHLLGQLSWTKIIYSAALREEQWLRLGAERWNPAQRVYSCVVFGVAHAANLVYAVATCGLLVLAGAVFMTVYLHELRTTGSRRRAVTASAKVHAHFNFTAIIVISAALAIYWVSTITSLLQ
jgi:hypothetical protein